MQGTKERRPRRMNNTSQGGAIEGNEADDTLLGSGAKEGVDIRPPPGVGKTYTTYPPTGQTTGGEAF